MAPKEASDCGVRVRRSPWWRTLQPAFCQHPTGPHLLFLFPCLLLKEKSNLQGPENFPLQEAGLHLSKQTRTTFCTAARLQEEGSVWAGQPGGSLRRSSASGRPRRFPDRARTLTGSGKSWGILHCGGTQHIPASAAAALEDKSAADEAAGLPVQAAVLAFRGAVVQ